MNELDRLIYVFSKLPGLGMRSARRIVLYLLQNRELKLKGLLDCMNHAMQKIIQCSCGNLDTVKPCSICSDIKRNNKIIAVVENISDIWSIEKSGVFSGKYHVLGGLLSASRDYAPDKFNLQRLKQVIEQYNVEEVIICTSSTVDGQTTAFFITDFLKDLNCIVSRLASGMPIGGEIDYLDESTISAAIKLRQPF